MENESCPPTETLYSSRYGCVYKCGRCEHLQVEFGNLVVGYTLESFRLFSHLIDSIDLEDENLYHGHLSRKIVLQPVHSSGYYCFSRDEVLDLQDLLQGTLTMLGIDDFLTQHALKRPSSEN
jgi:hypothetical protein